MAYQNITKYTSKNFTPASQVAAVFGQPRRIQSITIHWWGNYGQQFQNVVNFLCTNNTPTSAHYVIEAGKVACIVAPNDAAWHSGNAAGNATSIGLELRPEATDGDYATAAEVIRELRAVYGDLPLVPHKHWFNTACPGKWDLKRLDKLARGGAAAPASGATIKPIKEDTLSAAEVKEIKDYIDAKHKELHQAVREDIAGIIRRHAPRAPMTANVAGSDGKEQEITTATQLRWLDKMLREVRAIARVGLTEEQVSAAIREAMSDLVEVNVTVQGKDK